MSPSAYYDSADNMRFPTDITYASLQWGSPQSPTGMDDEYFDASQAERAKIRGGFCSGAGPQGAAAAAAAERVMTMGEVKAGAGAGARGVEGGEEEEVGEGEEEEEVVQEVVQDVDDGSEAESQAAAIDEAIEVGRCRMTPG